MIITKQLMKKFPDKKISEIENSKLSEVKAVAKFCSLTKDEEIYLFGLEKDLKGYSFLAFCKNKENEKGTLKKIYASELKRDIPLIEDKKFTPVTLKELMK